MKCGSISGLPIRNMVSTWGRRVHDVHFQVNQNWRQTTIDTNARSVSEQRLLLLNCDREPSNVQQGMGDVPETVMPNSWVAGACVCVVTMGVDERTAPGTPLP